MKCWILLIAFVAVCGSKRFSIVVPEAQADVSMDQGRCYAYTNCDPSGGLVEYDYLANCQSVNGGSWLDTETNTCYNL